MRGGIDIGFTRNATRAWMPRRAASESISASSGSELAVEAFDLVLERVVDFLRSFADAGEDDCPRDRRRLFSGGNNSPPETMSKPAPASASSFKMERFEFAFDGVADFVGNIAGKLVD